MSKFKPGDRVVVRSIGGEGDHLIPHFIDGHIYTVVGMVYGGGQVRIAKPNGSFAPRKKFFTLVNPKPFNKEEWL